MTPDREGTSPLSSHLHELMAAKQFPSGRQGLRCGWGGEVFQVQEGVPLRLGSSGSSVLTGEKVHEADCGASSTCDQ